MHVVPKPNSIEGQKQWRVVQDMRNHNKASKVSETFPLLNIKGAIQLIGDQKPKYFAKIDCKDGYHMMPLGSASRVFTAFICFMGIFQYKRVPMGQKGAASYFQRTMNQIFSGFVFTWMLIYLDDLIIWGNNLPELLQRLDLVAGKFREYNIKANPEKLQIGLQEIEWVGHVFNKDGIHFHKDKLQKVYDFKRPKNSKEMLAFLGLCNWFRDGVRDYSSKERVLRDMIKSASSSQSLSWNETQNRLFLEFKQIIIDAPELFYVDEHAEIIVETDACDYGYGGCAYQVINDKRRYIQFISKTFDKVQLGWSTPEKECYAIWYVLTTLRYMLEGIHFRLRTDHANLTYINDRSTTSQKVLRWKLDIQEFDFDIEHIAGHLNVVADCFSRINIPEWEETSLSRDDYDVLCRVEEDDALFVITEFKIPDNVYKLIGKIHNTIEGHHGINRTWIKAKAKIDELDKERKDAQASEFSENDRIKLRAYCQAFIMRCPICQVHSRLKTPIEAKKFTASTYRLMERINWDTIGPFDEDESGNQYVISIIDTFSRYLQLYPARDTTAKSAVDALVHHTGIFGVPLQITSDKGSQFVNSLISEFNAIGGAEQQIATAYSKEESAIIERSNKETGRHLRNFLFNNFIKEKWGMRLPLIARIHNTQVHESTGVAPYKLVLNNYLRLERNIFSDNLDHILIKRPPTADGLITSGVGAWAADQLRAQAILLEIAELNLRNKDLKHINATVTLRSDEDQPAEKKSKKSKSAKEKIAEFPINSYVLLDYPKSNYHAGPERKILAWKSGPFRVVNFVGNDYTIVDLLTDTEKLVHISRLSPFYYDKAYTIPYDVASANKGYFEVEKIIKAEGHVDNKTRLSFLVRWKGFDESKDSYVPHKDLVWNSAYYNWCKDQLKVFEQTLNNIQQKTQDWQNLTTAQIQIETKRYKKIHNILESDIKRFENDLSNPKNNSLSCLIES